MVITALDTSFNAVAVIEAYKSFIWTERYEDIGDFEICVPASAPYLDKLHNDFYIMCSDSPVREIRVDEDPGGLQESTLHKLMIIEKIEYKTDLEDGNTVLITGRSLESILQRRIIWKNDGTITEVNRDQIYKSGAYLNPSWDGDTTSPVPIEHAISYLLFMNVYGLYLDQNRKIENFLFLYNYDDELHPDDRVRNASIRPCSYRGNNLYDVIRDICKQCELSFDIRWNSSANSQGFNCFEMYLYKGDNHLSSQSANGYVCFSTEFDNLLSSDNSLDMSTYKTMAYFLGKGEKWSVKEYVNTEFCSAGWIRVYNNELYACKQDFKDHDVPMPRPDDKTPPNDPDNWALVSDWDHTIAYQAGSYVSYYVSYAYEIYRISQDIARYNSSTTYSAGSVVMGGSGSESWMYVSLQDQNNHPLSDSEWWYRCENENECFNAQDWEQVQSVQKENYDIHGDVQNNSTTGLDRRELFVDATNVPASYTYYPDGATERTYILEKGVYEATLRDKALSELTIPANRPTKFFDCEIETKVSFKFGKDYGIGDVIEVKDTYGFTDSVVVDSYVISHDESGILSAYPTFEAVESSTIITKYLTEGMALSTGTFLLKVPENTRFVDSQVIATAKNTTTNITYYLMSFVKKIKCDSTFSTGQTDRELHIVAWTTDQNVYTDGRYQPEDQVLKVGPAIVGTPMFYINIEGGITLPGVLNPSWLPPIDVDLGDILSVNENNAQYKNILIANL